MKVVRLKNNVVVEIIPDYALPVEKWYGRAFAEQCVDAPNEVEQHWIYNPEIKTWTEPKPESEPSTTTEDRVATLESENKALKAQISAQSEQMDFYEECIAEMASVVYA